MTELQSPFESAIFARRFWAHVDTTAGIFGCWPWLLSRDRDDYGRFGHRAQRFKAHRVAYQLVVGTIPVGVFACHTCDNPSCCNPAHLFLGTQADNMRDKIAKGRQARGQALLHGNVLTKESVRQIRAAANTGSSYKALALAFGVDPSLISHIVRRKRWAWVA